MGSNRYCCARAQKGNLKFKLGRFLGAGASLEAPEEKSARRLQRQPSIVKLNHVS